MKLDIRDLHIMLLSICDFHENWYREGSNFLVGVNEITVMYVP